MLPFNRELIPASNHVSSVRLEIFVLRSGVPAMADWYKRLHPWNRVVLTSLAALLVIRAASESLTIELMIGTPLVAATLWAFGWTMISAYSRVRRLRVS
jgi:hypothetical protein